MDVKEQVKAREKELKELEAKSQLKVFHKLTLNF